jgi:hypothetical protein
VTHKPQQGDLALNAQDERRLLGLFCRAWDARGTEDCREATEALAEWFGLGRHVRKAERIERRQARTDWLVSVLRDTDPQRDSR